MTTDASPRLKITYATLRNDNEELHAQFEAGLAKARAELLGGYHRNFVGGAERDGDGTFEKRSPIDGSVMGTFAKGTRSDVADAVAAARAAFPAWAGRPWQERVAILRKVADVISERQMEFSALLAMEVGKNRLEALGDVEETADLIRWSCDMMERNEGFDHVMGNLGDEAVHTRASSSRTACGASSARSTSRSPCPADRPAAPSWPATRSSTSPARTRRSAASACSRRCATPASRTACSTW